MSGGALTAWRIANFKSMVLVGTMTTTGLWQIGIDLVLVLGVIAARLSFIHMWCVCDVLGATRRLPWIKRFLLCLPGLSAPAYRNPALLLQLRPTHSNKIMALQASARAAGWLQLR